MRLSYLSLIGISLFFFLPPAQAQWRTVGNVTGVQSLHEGVEISAGETKSRITALSSNVLRLRYTAQGQFPEDHSFAVLPNAFSDSPQVDVKDSAEAVVISTGALQVRITKSPFSVAFG